MSAWKRFWAVACAAGAALLAGVLFAPGTVGAPGFGWSYEKRDEMIPMRDGVRLHTEIYSPRSNNGPFPVLLMRTPYGTADDAGGNSNHLGTYSETLADGYIFVVQDIRGRFGSDGEFVMLRPPHDPADARGTDETTDAWDTVEWLLKNVAGHNGRVGITGISYPGWLAEMAALDPHPAVRAVSEQASIADMFLGDDFHHNGALRLSYCFEYTAMLETSRKNYDFPFEMEDTYNWYLSLGPLSTADRRYFHGKMPTWNHLAEHPNYDAFWKAQSVRSYAGAPRVPNLNVAGWWDQEDFYGPMEIYRLQARSDPKNWNFLVVGPWNHGGWAHGSGRKLGPVDFSSDTSRYFRSQIQRVWFDYWLKERGQLPFRKAQVFQTGANRWESYDAWPPPSAQPRALYFREKGALSFEPPPEGQGKEGSGQFDSYVSDPANPVPYRQRPILPTYQGPGWATWLLEDQSFVDQRADVLTWATPPLAEQVTIAGDIVAHLYASTTGTDSDWIVKLIDEYPPDASEGRMAGYKLMIADEVFRGRFRESFEKPEPIEPGKTTLYKIGLHTNDHAFLRGHRIRVQVQSTWFPLIDRNPQTYVPNIFLAQAEDYHSATQRIYRSREFASHIELPLIPH